MSNTDLIVLQKGRIVESNDINLSDFYNSVFVDLILTRQCNFRCKYCALNFENFFLGENVLKYIYKFLIELSLIFKFVDVEFFGGEPLLNYKIIYKILRFTKNIYNIRYKVVTNGSLFKEDIIDFLMSNNVQIVFSVSSNNIFMFSDNCYKTILTKLVDYDNLIVNFIIEPGKYQEGYYLLDKLSEWGFKKVALIPVVYTMDRTKEDILFLKDLKNKLLKAKGLKKIYFMRNTDSNELIRKNQIDLLIDYNGDFYFDNEAELYLLKDLVPRNIFDYNNLRVGNIRNYNIKVNYKELINEYKKFIKVKRGKYFKKIINYLNRSKNFDLLKEVL